MINIAEIQHELAQARQARIAAQLAGCEVEELADTLRQSQPRWRQPAPARSLHPRRAVNVLVVGSP